MTQQRGKPKNAGEAIYFAALDAREFAENLQPLLQLLDEPESEGQSPLDQIKGLLSAIVTILSDQNDTLARIEAVLSSEPLSSASAETTSSGN